MAVAVIIGVTIPPRRLTLATPEPDHTVPGIIHVHSNRSDGSRSPDEIAAAAARAGLKFVVFTDHGDATRTPDAPAYRSGVLCIDAVEISTSGGHYIALDMPASPYPLAGEPRDVVQDVRRLGGFGIVAHPDSPKPTLQWSDWTVPFDAVEAVNLDTNWRRWVSQALDHGARLGERWYADRRLLASLVNYPFRSAETIAGLSWAGAGLAALDRAAAQPRRIVITAGADAHARIAWRGDPWDTTSRWSLPIPGYDSTFRALSLHVSIERPLTGEAVADARLLTRAVREGHLYVALDGLATPPSFEFTASNALGTVHEGDELWAGGPVTLHVRSNVPPSFTTEIRNGAHVVTADRHEADFSVQVPGEPAAYFVEIRSGDRTRLIPWLQSNPIFIRGNASAPAAPAAPAVPATQSLFDGASTEGWRIESDQTSQAAFDIAQIVSGAAVRLRYALAGSDVASPFVALVRRTPGGLTPNDRLAVTIRADRPMRVSVQLRTDAEPRGEERWQRSVYVSASPEDRTVYFDDCRPVGVTHSEQPPLADVRSVMFVIDTTNTRPGATGRLWISALALQR